MSDAVWEKFEIEQLLEKKNSMTFPYLEFLRTPNFSCGLYTLVAGAKDLQGPHDEDEIYFVIDGRAHIRFDDEVQEVQRGSVIYVPASSEHRFVEIDEDITLLVFFGSSDPES